MVGYVDLDSLTASRKVSSLKSSFRSDMRITMEGQSMND